ncbi:uncharacterized protein LOC106672780 [Cimex lectularius]|uniref:m7GpppN-mRNA hydrolase n=1 Tax=Cimex lectularius TaxID=79782 RepID=A0A8I6SAC1_CIMLE|nr:uncharacterized protein LOC106672780 [Cimex lectularius]
MEVQINVIDRNIPTNVLDDLCSRFIINVPEEERNDLIRLCFQIELAHWFYIDFYCKSAKKTIGIKEFAHSIFQHIPSLHQYLHNVDKIIDEWKEYKYLVPTFGAILLNEDLSYVLLVQSYYSRSSWGFPKGKVNKDEPPWGCAIREVYEETGFNIRDMIDPNEYLDARVNEQLVRLYIIPGVSKNAKFQPMTRNEIKSVEWFPLADLPVTKKDVGYRVKGPGNESFYMVGPFVRRLRQWIYERQNKPIRRPRRARHNSCSDIDHLGHKDYPSTKFLKNIKEIKNKTMSELGVSAFMALSQDVDEDNDTSPNEEDVRNISPEAKVCDSRPLHCFIQPNKQIQNNSSDMEKLLLMFPKLSLSEKKVNEKDQRYTDRSSFDIVDVKDKPKSIELASFLKALEQSQRSSSGQPLNMALATADKIGRGHKLRRVKRKIEFDSLADSEYHLVPINENEKVSDNDLKLGNDTDGKIQLKFNEITLSESIKNNGISHWCNFKFDLQSILKCIDEVKA